MSSPSSTVSPGTAAARAVAPSLSRSLVLDALSGMDRGCLRLELPDGGEHVIGDAAGPGPHALIRVRREAFFRKCFWSGDIGFGESFVDGDWEIGRAHV